MKFLTSAFCALLVSGGAAAIDLNGLKSIAPVTSFVKTDSANAVEVLNWIIATFVPRVGSSLLDGIWVATSRIAARRPVTGAGRWTSWRCFERSMPPMPRLWHIDKSWSAEPSTPGSLRDDAQRRRGRRRNVHPRFFGQAQAN